MQFLAVCTFELKAASDAQHEAAYAALEKLGFRRSLPANEPGLELPADAVVGVFDVSAKAPQGQVAFLRNCLSFKLREAFQRTALDAEFLLVVSQGDLAWERGGYRPADFAARHGRGALPAAAAP